MKVTAPLHYFPYICAATGRDDGEIIDTGVDMPSHPNLPTHLYLNAAFLRELATEELDMVPGEDVRALEQRVQDMGVSIAELMEQLAALTSAENIANKILEEAANA